jgi:hypothetical protein
MDSSRQPLHEVYFYSDNGGFVRRLARVLATDLMSGKGVMVVATEEHRGGLAREFAALGLDAKLAQSAGRYVSLDAHETVIELLGGPGIDPAWFSDSFGGLLDEISGRSEHPCVSVFGEIVALLMAESKPEEAIRLERIWNGLAREHDFALRCAYPVSQFQKLKDSELFMRVCAEHTDAHVQ